MKTTKALFLTAVSFSLVLSSCAPAPTNTVSSTISSTSAEKSVIEEPENTSAFGKKTPSGTAVKTGFTPNYLISNNITISDPYPDEDNTGIEISGLKDEKVQKIVNDKIDNALQQLKAADPVFFNGNQPKPKNAVLKDDYVTAFTVGNFSNILSVELYRTSVYSDPEQSDEQYPIDTYLTTWKYITFDLNTGEEINLADIFIDGFDYADYINNLLEQRIDTDGDSYYYSFDMLSPRGVFKGLLSEPQFYISSYGLVLCFDKTSEEFVTESANVNIPFDKIGDNLAITKRFSYNGNEIYTDTQTENKLLVSSYYSENTVQKTEEDINVNGSNIHIYVSLKYPSVPTALADLLTDKYEIGLEDIKKQAAGFSSSVADGSYYKDIDAKKYGCYVSCSTYEYGDFYTTDRNSETNVMYEINGDNYKEIELKDIFTDGFDWESALASLGVEYYSNEGYGEEYKAFATEEFFKDKLKNDIDYFMLYDSSLEIYFKNIEDSNTPIYGIYCNYSDIGCDNLTIFHD